MMATLDERYQIDDLAAQAGGYFAPPTEENMAYTELLFDVCRRSNAGDLGKAAGGEDRHPTGHSPCIFCLTHTVTHTGK